MVNWTMAGVVPSHLLHISLTGKFWKGMEQSLSDSVHVLKHRAGATAASKHGSAMDVIYIGPSMNSTLWTGDLLTVKPYGHMKPRAGDVIYFRPKGQPGIVHRVLRVHPTAVTTRGDSNREEDPYTVRRDEITGKVIAARRASSLREIPGGKRGLFFAYLIRFQKPVLIQFLRFLRRPYRRLAATGIFQYLLPKRLRPKVVRFQPKRFAEEFKLIISGREVGRYDKRNHSWRISHPYRLLIDEGGIDHPITGLQNAERIATTVPRLPVSAEPVT